jgi:hypothetical protein
MKTMSAFTTLVVAFLVALPSLAAAGRAQRSGRHTLVGTVVFVNPAEMAVATDDGLQVLEFGPGLTRPAGIVRGDRVEVQYGSVPGHVTVATRRMPRHRAATIRRASLSHRGHARHAAMGAHVRRARLHEVSGHVVSISADVLVLGTQRGLQTFALAATSSLPNVAPGDELVVRYRRLSGQRLPIVAAQSARAPRSTS